VGTGTPDLTPPGALPPAQTPTPAVEQYKILMSANQYEVTNVWTRSGLFAAANAALLGFTANALLAYVKDSMGVELGVVFLLAIVGLLLCVCWLLIVRAGLRWQDHWQFHLKEIEPDVFGSRRILREHDPAVASRDLRAGVVRARVVILLFVIVALVGWVVLLGIAGYVTYTKHQVAPVDAGTGTHILDQPQASSAEHPGEHLSSP